MSSVSGRNLVGTAKEKHGRGRQIRDGRQSSSPGMSPPLPFLILSNTVLARFGAASEWTGVYWFIALKDVGRGDA